MTRKGSWVQVPHGPPENPGQMACAIQDAFRLGSENPKCSNECPLDPRRLGGRSNGVEMVRRWLGRDSPQFPEYQSVSDFVQDAMVHEIARTHDETNEPEVRAHLGDYLRGIAAGEKGSGPNTSRVAIQSSGATSAQGCRPPVCTRVHPLVAGESGPNGP